MSKVLVTGGAGIGGVETARQLLAAGFDVRLADIAPPPASENLGHVEFLRCDTRTPDDVRRAVAGVDAVVHLAAWHCAHNPPVSDPTIFAVNVDGTFNVFEACRAEGVRAVVYASSMAFGWGGVYGVTKVIGEDLCRSYHEMTGMAVAQLRYHDFVPKPYLAFGAKLLQNGVDRRDVAASNVASVRAALDRKIGLFRTIVHTDHGMPPEVVADFSRLGPHWCEAQVPGSLARIEKYRLRLPNRVEQHDLSDAERQIGWTPKVNFLTFLRDLAERDARGEDVSSLWAAGQIPEATA